MALTETKVFQNDIYNTMITMKCLRKYLTKDVKN